MKNLTYTLLFVLFALCATDAVAAPYRQISSGSTCYAGQHCKGSNIITCSKSKDSCDLKKSTQNCTVCHASQKIDTCEANAQCLAPTIKTCKSGSKCLAQKGTINTCEKGASCIARKVTNCKNKVSRKNFQMGNFNLGDVCVTHINTQK